MLDTSQSVAAADGSTPPTVVILTSVGYAGECTDPSGLTCRRARWCDPSAAAFLSIDPLVDRTCNPDGYTGGSPLQYGDPRGLDWRNPLSWTGTTHDNTALSATVFELAFQLPAVAAAATGVGLPEAGVLEAAASTLAVMSTFASAIGASSLLGREKSR